MKQLGIAIVAVAVLALQTIGAHEMEVKGTVVAVEKARVQVKILGENGKPTGKSEWFAVTDKTKVRRGDAEIAFAIAKIKKDERIVILVEHGDEAGVEWTCTMHPEIGMDEPGVCPKCGMKLVKRDRPAKATEIRLGAATDGPR